jgi:hypothetical protein
MTSNIESGIRASLPISGRHRRWTGAIAGSFRRGIAAYRAFDGGAGII